MPADDSEPLCVAANVEEGKTLEELADRVPCQRPGWSGYRRAAGLSVVASACVGCVLFLSFRHDSSSVASSIRDNLGLAEQSSSAESPAPLKEFYMYRVQSDENYSPENQDMANIGGALWYLHNEIIWHHWIRAGSFSSTPKTRIERFHVKTRATRKLYERGMNFGVVNTFDLGRCSGPFDCGNLDEYGPAVGCESWTPNQGTTTGTTDAMEVAGNNFPHEQWIGKNMYPNAVWYSLPGECTSRRFWDKDDACALVEPGGACPPNVTPTGEDGCTYSYKKVGEVSIDEVEGISTFDDFIQAGGKEYIRATDKGEQMSFWDGKSDPAKCASRIKRVEEVFAAKYPDQPELADPDCDFDVHKLYPHFPNGTFG